MYSLHLKSILKEAWEKVHGAKKAFFFALLIFGIAQLIFFSLRFFLEKDNIAWINFIVILAYLFALGPIIAGFYMMGFKRAQGENVYTKQCLAYFPKILPIFITQILIMITIWFVFFCISFLGLVFLSLAYKFSPILFHGGFALLAVIYLALFLTLMPILHFAIIIVADQNSSPWQAYKTSFKKAFSYWKILFPAQGIILLMNIAGAILFGIGLLWTIPFLYITTGILYREIFKR